jgi:hypothetical protein
MDRSGNQPKGESADLFGGAARADARAPLTVFHAELISFEQTSWR